MKIPSSYGSYVASRAVLVRVSHKSPWKLDIYCKYLPSIDKHQCNSGIWKYCIPFTETSKHFLGTFDDVQFECTNVITDVPVLHARQITTIQNTSTTTLTQNRVRPIL